MNSALAREGVSNVKVRYDEGEVLIFDKEFCSKDETRKTNPVSSKVKASKICLSDPVARKHGGTKIKLAGMPRTQKPRRQGPSPDVVKRIRSDKVLKYFKPKLRSNKVQKKEGSKVGKQGILSSRCEVRLEKIYVEGQLTECREKPLAKVDCHENILQALVLKPKTIKQVLHNKSVYSKFNEGHEDDLFGQSKGQVGFGPFKKLKSNWEGKLLLKDDSSGDESGSSSKSDVVRGQSPARWSLACQPVSPKADERSDTPERWSFFKLVTCGLVA